MIREESLIKGPTQQEGPRCLRCLNMVPKNSCVVFPFVWDLSPPFTEGKEQPFCRVRSLNMVFQKELLVS